MVNNNNNSNQVKKVKIGGGSFGEKKEFTYEEVSKLLDIDDNSSSPYSFVFDDSNNHLYFLSNVKGQSNIKNIHYIDMNSTNKEIKPLFDYVDKDVELSLEDQLQRERQRIVANGITQFTYDQEHKFFITGINNKIHKIDISESITKPKLKEIPGEVYNNSLSSDGKLISFIKEKDIWVTDIESGRMHRLTYSNDAQHKFRYAGEVGFIYQEEFSRYIGYWWSPVVQVEKSTNKSIYRILYFEEDETNVRDFHISTPNHKGDTTHYKYPLAGDQNSSIKVNLIEFSFGDNAESIDIKKTQLFDLKNQFEWVEYYTRAGWLPNGHAVWLQLLDRKQQKQVLTVIPLSSFTSTFTNKLPVIIEETTEYWINVVDSIHFFSDSKQLIWSGECDKLNNGFRHLSLIKWDDNYSNITSTPITQHNKNEEEWMISGDELFVDESKHLVYFISTKDTCLEQHLYVKNYNDNNSEIKRLTIPNNSHKSIKISKDFKNFISTYSNHKTPNKTQIFSLEYNNSSNSYPLLKPQFFISNNGIEEIDNKQNNNDIDKIGSFKAPEIFSFINSKGIKIYGQYTKPIDFDSTKKYPTVLYVYGGPHVQLVRNTYSYIRQYYANFGFIQVMIDGAGSTNRGLKFEGQVKHKMGITELQDQIEGIEYLINNNIVPIDRSRIAITGWSYGGYFSLMAISQRPDFFKIAISGAPVTFWEAYDSGYTERYMDTPANNPEGYKTGSVMNYIDGFPDEENRLVIIHGLQDENVHFSNTSCLIDSLTRNQKPYILKVLASERHGIRNLENRIYIETFCVNFLNNNL